LAVLTNFPLLGGGCHEVTGGGLTLTGKMDRFRNKFGMTNARHCEERILASAPCGKATQHVLTSKTTLLRVANNPRQQSDVTIQKNFEIKAGLLRKQGLLFTRNDELTSFNCVINLNNNLKKQVSVFEACFLS